MDPTARILMMVAFWASFAALWAVFYKVRPIPFLRNTFTMQRWGTNPFQLYNLLLLLQVSANQIIIGGVAENTAQGALDHQAQLALSVCNLVGTAICAFGLHLRDLEFGLWVELSGYVALIGSLGIYIGLVFALFPLPNTSFGLAACEAFVLASIHRAIQIIQYKWLRYRRTAAEAEALRKRLDSEQPR
jgi:hypothetical protein